MARKVDWKDTAVRAVKTAVQVFIALVGTNAAGWTNVEAVKAAGLSAITAGVSVLMNAIMGWAGSK